MDSNYINLPGSNPIETVMLSLIATVVGIGLLLAFILLRRALRKRHFRDRDQRVLFLRDNWQKILSGEIPAKAWFSLKMDRDIVEDILLDRIASVKTEELQPLQELARRSGLLERRVHQVLRGRGWNKRQALIVLGRMRLYESILVLAEALQDKHDETVIDAIRSLGQVGTPEAAKPILEHLARNPDRCPEQIVQTSLAQCYQSDPQQLLNEVLEAEDAIRPVMARALAEVANSQISGDLMKLALDSLPEVRASSARIIAAVKPSYALNVLSMLAGDSEWFVRLRAAVAIGECGEIHGIPLLVNALCDRNRFVRLRAASELVSFRGEEARVIQLAIQTEDRYAMQALISEIERSGRLPEMVNDLASDTPQPATESVVLTVLQNGFVSILADLLLNHPDPRVCARLARLLAQSSDASLLEHLKQINASVFDVHRQKLLHMVIAQLRQTIETGDSIIEAVSA